nr:hypothetical protein [Tanacetum cinerariifolium]
MYKLREDVRNIREELAEYIDSPIWNCPIFFYEEDEEYTIQYREYLEKSPNAVTTILPTEEPEYSLSMGYEHLNIIPKTESDEVTKYNAKNLEPIPSECEVTSKDESECDMPANDESSSAFMTFTNSLFDNNDNFTSSDDESLPDEDEFSGELAHINLILPELKEADFDFKEEILLIENLLYDNSSPRPPEELNVEIADMIVESFPSFLIPVQDNDSQREEINIVSETDELLPLSFENDDYDPGEIDGSHVSKRSSLDQWGCSWGFGYTSNGKFLEIIVATGATPPKTKASVRKMKSSSDTTVTPPLTAVAGTRLFTSTKDEGTGTIPGVPDIPTEESGEESSWKSSDEGDDGDDDEERNDDDQDEGDDDDDDQEEGNDDDQDSDEEGKEFIHPRISVHDEEEKRDEESFDPIPKTSENIDDEDSEDEGDGEEDLGLNIGEEERHDEEEEEDEIYRYVNINQGRGFPAFLEVKDSHVTLTLVKPDDPLPITTPTMTSSTIATRTTTSLAPILPTTVLSDIIQHLPSFGSLFQFDDRLRENDKFLRTVDENVKKIIKEFVKEQVKVQVSKILPRIEQAVSEQLEADVLTRSSHSSRTSYDVDVDLSKMELKKILIEKMEGNKSIQRSNEQRNLYKALVDAYEFDKIILNTYGETVTLKRRRDDDADKDEEPSAGPDQGSTQGSRLRQASASESAFAEEPMQTTSQMEEPSHLKFDTEMELKKIFIEKMEGNKSIHRSNEQKNLYMALIILDTYRDTVTLKRHRDDDADKDE